MRITSIQPEVIQEIPFLNAGRGAGGFYRVSLPVQHGFVDALPGGMSALVVTADLQGRETVDLICCKTTVFVRETDIFGWDETRSGLFHEWHLESPQVIAAE